MGRQLDARGRSPSRSPQERREYEEEQRRIRARKKELALKEKRNGSRAKPAEAEGPRVSCGICGYDQLDVMTFANNDCKTRIGGVVRINICPECQTTALARMDLTVIGPAVPIESETWQGQMMQRAEGSRVRMF